MTILSPKQLMKQQKKRQLERRLRGSASGSDVGDTSQSQASSTKSGNNSSSNNKGQDETSSVSSASSSDSSSSSHSGSGNKSKKDAIASVVKAATPIRRLNSNNETTASSNNKTNEEKSKTIISKTTSSSTTGKVNLPPWVKKNQDGTTATNNSNEVQSTAKLHEEESSKSPTGQQQSQMPIPSFRLNKQTIQDISNHKPTAPPLSISSSATSSSGMGNTSQPYGGQQQSDEHKQDDDDDDDNKPILYSVLVMRYDESMKLSSSSSHNQYLPQPLASSSSSSSDKGLTCLAKYDLNNGTKQPRNLNNNDVMGGVMSVIGTNVSGSSSSSTTSTAEDDGQNNTLGEFTVDIILDGKAHIVYGNDTAGIYMVSVTNPAYPTSASSDLLNELHEDFIDKHTRDEIKKASKTSFSFRDKAMMHEVCVRYQDPFKIRPRRNGGLVTAKGLIQVSKGSTFNISNKRSPPKPTMTKSIASRPQPASLLDNQSTHANEPAWMLARNSLRSTSTKRSVPSPTSTKGQLTTDIPSDSIRSVSFHDGGSTHRSDRSTKKDTFGIGSSSHHSATKTNTNVPSPLFNDPKDSDGALSFTGTKSDDEDDDDESTKGSVKSSPRSVSDDISSNDSPVVKTPKTSTTVKSHEPEWMKKRNELKPASTHKRTFEKEKGNEALAAAKESLHSSGPSKGSSHSPQKSPYEGLLKKAKVLTKETPTDESDLQKIASDILVEDNDVEHKMKEDDGDHDVSMSRANSSNSVRFEDDVKNENAQVERMLPDKASSIAQDLALQNLEQNPTSPPTEANQNLHTLPSALQTKEMRAEETYMEDDKEDAEAKIEDVPLNDVQSPSSNSPAGSIDEGTVVTSNTDFSGTWNPKYVDPDYESWINPARPVDTERQNKINEDVNTLLRKKNEEDNPYGIYNFTPPETESLNHKSTMESVFAHRRERGSYQDGGWSLPSASTKDEIIYRKLFERKSEKDYRYTYITAHSENNRTSVTPGSYWEKIRERHFAKEDVPVPTFSGTAYKNKDMPFKLRSTEGEGETWLPPNSAIVKSDIDRSIAIGTAAAALAERENQADSSTVGGVSIGALSEVSDWQPPVITRSRRVDFAGGIVQSRALPAEVRKMKSIQDQARDSDSSSSDGIPWVPTPEYGASISEEDVVKPQLTSVSDVEVDNSSSQDDDSSSEEDDDDSDDISVVITAAVEAAKRRNSPPPVSNVDKDISFIDEEIGITRTRSSESRSSTGSGIVHSYTGRISFSMEPELITFDDDPNEDRGSHYTGTIEKALEKKERKLAKAQARGKERAVKSKGNQRRFGWICYLLVIATFITIPTVTLVLIFVVFDLA